MEIIGTGRTHVGRRDHNEDAHCLEPDMGLYVVADGMGGYEGGELASRLVVDAIREFFQTNHEDDGLTWPYGLRPELTWLENMVSASVRMAHQRVVKRRVGRYAQMGSTVAMVAVEASHAVIGHIGDSRVYRWRDGELMQLTRDHSLYNAMQDSGHDDLPPLKDFRHGNVITRALGFPMVDDAPELHRATLREGDVFVLCTDGLIERLEDDDLADTLSVHAPGEACEILVEEAYARGGRDNITAVVLHVPSP